MISHVNFKNSIGDAKRITTTILGCHPKDFGKMAVISGCYVIMYEECVSENKIREI